MRSESTADGTLVVTYDSTALPKLILGAGALFALTAVYDYWVGARGTERMVGLFVAVTLCVAAGLGLLERSRFSFDATSRTVTWRRRWAWWVRGGIIPFDAIKDVVVQTMGEGRTYPSRRVCLQPVDGALLPLTAGYAPDPKGELIGIGDRIRTTLGRGTRKFPGYAGSSPFGAT